MWERYSLRVKKIGSKPNEIREAAVKVALDVVELDCLVNEYYGDIMSWLDDVAFRLHEEVESYVPSAPVRSQLRRAEDIR